MSRAAASIAAAALALAAMQAHGMINKCVDGKGKVSYQEGVCPQGTKQEKVTVMPGPQPAPPAKSATPAAALPGGMLPAKQDVADPRMDAAVAKLADYEGCQSAPGWSRTGEPAYRAWRAENAALLDRLPRSQRYMKVLVVERQRVQSRLARPETRKAFLDSCQSLAAPAAASRSRQ